jgi:hypothetical protein
MKRDSVHLFGQQVHHPQACRCHSRGWLPDIARKLAIAAW